MASTTTPREKERNPQDMSEKCVVSEGECHIRWSTRWTTRLRRAGRPKTGPRNTTRSRYPQVVPR
eukprot:2407768-Rhodomonas_salina.1